MTSVPPPFEHPGSPPPRPELPEGAPLPEPAAASGALLPPLGVPWWSPFVALLATLTAVIVVAIVVGIFVGLDADQSDTVVTLVLTGVQFAALVAAAWWTVQLFGGRPEPAAFGFAPTRPLPALGWTALAYLALWAATLVVVLAFGEPEEQQLVQDIQDEDSLVVLFGFAAVSCVVAPIVEELFFRGFMFRALAERMSVWWAAPIAGIVFGFSHAAGSPLTSIVVLSVFGIALCLLLARTGSLIPCIMLHAFNNSISFSATKELPWWGFIAVIVGSVGTTLLVSLLVARRRSAPA
jgi:membrane protease YdiL (CAAX protease family)